MNEYIRLKIRKTWDSISFRLMVNYGLLAFFSILVLLAFIYLQVIGTLHSQAAQLATASMSRLEGEFIIGGRKGLIQAINMTISDQIDESQGIYLLLDENGHKLAGNLEYRPKLTETNKTEVPLVLYGSPTTARMLETTLPDRSILMTGIDLDSMKDIIRKIGQACLVTVFIAFLLVMVGVHMFRKELDYRVGSIRKTAVKISEGNLSSRIPLSATKDEFYFLSSEINSMLDKIESLMTGVRHVSNTIAHNLRTPLTRILNQLRSVENLQSNESELRAVIHRSINEIESLNKLFEKLLYISEIESGIQRQRFWPCDLEQIADDVVDMYEAYAEEKNLSLKFQSTGQAMVWGDADLLASMLSQLIENAIKYARQDICVRITKSAKYISLLVSDDGPGIPADEYPNIGQHFHQLNPDSSGFGLGLASVRAILSLHDGKLHFSDNQPGLIVHIQLPVFFEEAQQKNSKPA
ncbi:ATP-binding protein [Advenella sp. RU8]|uniref:HAMP domain-containing sensor histidine kinase n=1 Tax=Advenella sp. RU8 TaxID=3399575 RepID=UPI003AAC140B